MTSRFGAEQIENGDDPPLIVAEFTESDMAMSEIAARRGVQYTDYDPSAYDGAP